VSKVKLISLGICCLISVLGFVSQAQAGPTSLPYSTTGLGPLMFQADTFSLGGQSGTVLLSTDFSTIAGINTAVFTTGNSPGFNGSESLLLSYTLTLDGVSETLSQSATWTVTESEDGFITFAASSPVLFVTPAGDWYVSLNSYAFGPVTSVGVTESQSTMATFTPVPEPASMMLFGSGLLLIGGMLRVGTRRKSNSESQKKQLQEWLSQLRVLGPCGRQPGTEATS